MLTAAAAASQRMLAQQATANPLGESLLGMSEMFEGQDWSSVVEALGWIPGVTGKRKEKVWS